MTFTDPRSVIAEFFEDGDSSGPLGQVAGAGRIKDAGGASKWFSVFRPTTDDAIDQMRAGKHTGKGLNIKGKSAKSGRLSGMVPFLQINKNEHRTRISTSPSHARVWLYFTSLEAQAAAQDSLNKTLNWMVAEVASAREAKKVLDEHPEKFDDNQKMDIYNKLFFTIDDPAINKLDSFAPHHYGLDVPERLLTHVYITTQDLTVPAGWETGRGSEPHFMDMNLHALRDPSEPQIVLLQVDENPMNPRGLVMAYAEAGVKAVVSDFDPFLTGSRGMAYNPLNAKDFELMKWCLEGTKEVLSKGSASWTSSWINIMARAHAKNFHPKLPKYGFGDSTTCDLIHHLVESMAQNGGVRHGAECFNWYFPQELDDQFLVVWDGFAELPAKLAEPEPKVEPVPSPGFYDRLMEMIGCCASRDRDDDNATAPAPQFAPAASAPGRRWSYLTESELREFLKERVTEGYIFPLNPAWTVRDKGWYEVLNVMRTNAACKGALDSWYPEESGILALIDEIHKEYPEGLKPPASGDQASHGSGTEHSEEDPEAAADLARLQLRRKLIFRRAKAKFRASAVLLASEAKVITEEVLEGK